MNILILNIFAACMAGIVPTFQALAQNESLTPVSVVLLTDTFLLLTALIACMVKKVPLKLQKSEIAPFAFSGACLFFTDFSLNAAYAKIPVGLVTVIHFLYPTLVCLSNIFIQKEKFTLYKLISIILSLSGMILIYAPTYQNGVMLAFASSVAYCLYLTSIEKYATENKHTFSPIKTYFYAAFIETIIAYTLNINVIKNMQITSAQVSYCALSGMLLAVTGIILETCVNKIGSSTASLLFMFEPLVSVIISTISFNYTLKLKIMVGCALLTLSLIPPIIEYKKTK